MRSILNMILGLDNTMSGVPVTTMNSAVTLSLMNDGADAREQQPAVGEDGARQGNEAWHPNDCSQCVT